MNFNTRNIDYDKLKAVYYVGLTGNMTHAGQMMGLCQSAVTKQVQDLESRFNAILFDRADRQLSLTHVGQKVFEFAKFLVESSNALVKGITHSRLDMEGQLNILSTPSLANTWLPYYLRGFGEKYPNIHLKITGSLEFLAPVDTDIIIGDYKSNQPDFVQLPLYTEELGFYASHEYLERYGTPKNIDDLDRHRLLALDPKIEEKFPYVNQILRIGKADKRENRKACLYAHSHDALANLALLDYGIARLSKQHVHIVGKERLVNVLPDEFREATRTYFIYHKKVEDFRKYTAMYEHLMSRLQSEENS